MMFGIKTGLALYCFFLSHMPGDRFDYHPITGSKPIVQFQFEENTQGSWRTSTEENFTGNASFEKGFDGMALRVAPDPKSGSLSLESENLQFNPDNSFSFQFWIRTQMDPGRKAVIISQKTFNNTSLASQKNAGWVFYISGGTWAWNMGTGTRRITYERDNGKHMPVNDGKWHQLTMTYDAEKSEVRLFYDGENKVVYSVSDSAGFNFSSGRPLVIGSEATELKPQSNREIEMGRQKLQELVNEFNRLGVKEIAPEEFESLIVDPEELFNRKAGETKALVGQGRKAFPESLKADLEAVIKLRAELKKNPYTMYQVRDFMKVAPLLKIYSLVDGKVIVHQEAARKFLKEEKLSPPDFGMDNLTIWDRALSPEEVMNSYSESFQGAGHVLQPRLNSITAGVWNIHHGGKHFTVEKDGWDSRMRTAEILKEEGCDVIMMQETYSSGDFIAAELGYYFATTVDKDGLNQVSNISVLSRYPVKEIYVPKGASFMNVAVKVAISETQDMYVMSNWYGMQQFNVVFDFHQFRFEESDTIPTLFAGDFNAISHLDGGKSPASEKLLNAGFTDAFRSLYPDVKKYPGFSHQNGRRIDQFYYKGKGLKNTSAKIISSWPTGFPSDHFLIISTFDLNYSTDKVTSND